MLLSPWAFAQHVTMPNPPWWPGYQFCGHLDVPNYDPHAVTLCGDSDPQQTIPIPFARRTDYFAGWAALEIDGTQPTQIRVSYLDDAGAWHPLSVTVFQRLYRPDVYATLVGAWPHTTMSEGYAIYFADPDTVPLGVHRFAIQQSSDGNTVQMADSLLLDVQA